MASPDFRRDLHVGGVEFGGQPDQLRAIICGPLLDLGAVELFALEQQEEDKAQDAKPAADVAEHDPAHHLRLGA